MEANQEMIDGYIDGRDANNPEPSLNRSRSYRHGFLAGRSDLNGPTHGYQQMIEMADAAMAADAMETMGVGKP
jgi:hypothetical protein